MSGGSGPLARDLRLAIALARRELRGGLRGFRIFLACLALGVAAIAAIGSVRAAIEAGLAREGAALLGGDAQIELTYRFADEAERSWMEANATHLSETVDFRSMVVVEGPDGPERGLTQVRAVDEAYPLIGSVTLTPPMALDAAFAGARGRPGAVIEQALADRLGVAPGDVIQLGAQEFVLSAILTRYPDSAAGGFALGPRSLVLLEDLAESGLIAPGTLFSTQYRLDLPVGADLDALRSDAETRFENKGLRWSDARNGAPGIAIFVDRLGAFLVLVGLAGLAVGGVGVSAAVRAYLAGKTEVIATLKTLGATRRVIFATYSLQIAALTALGVGLGLLLGAGVPLLLAPVISAALPFPAVFGLYPGPLFEAAIYGVLTAALFTLWPLARAGQTRAAALYRDALGGARLLPGLPTLLVTALLLAALVAIAIAFSGTMRLTLWTLGGIVFALALLVLAALATRALARRAGRRMRRRPGLRLALGAIAAPGGEVVSVVLSLGLGLSVLATIGQIDGTMQRAISSELPDVAPSYFVVDIQPDQIDGFRARLDAAAGVEKVDAAPMLRGIITRINGRPAEEVAGDHWVIQGDRGVTYSAKMPKGTTLTEGSWWPADYSGPNLVSVDAEAAAEIGLALGDTLSVNILGRDIDAQIASFREVDFETAGIGFVLAMNPAALAGAPHSWIATIYASQEAEGPVIRELANAYPNITAIRVGDAIARVSDLLAGIAGATRYGAMAALVTGFLVLIGAALAGERARAYEAAVMKTLGATRGWILRSFALRAALMGLAAGLVALSAGIAGAWAVARYIFEIEYAVIWPNALLVVGGGVAVSLAAGLAFALRPLAARPARVLRARD